jgi:hypothetical protein
VENIVSTTSRRPLLRSRRHELEADGQCICRVGLANVLSASSMWRKLVVEVESAGELGGLTSAGNTRNPIAYAAGSST